MIRIITGLKKTIRHIMTRLSCQKGFSMIETALTIPLVAIIFALASQVMMIQIDSYELVAGRQGNLTDARYALDRVADEILYLKSADIVLISSTSMDFVDNDGNNTSFEEVTNNDSTISLMRGEDELLSDISSFTLSYFDSNGVATYTIPSIRQIEISIVTKTIGSTPGIALSTTVIPRNFVYASYQ